jgi:hypothetical protein
MHAERITHVGQWVLSSSGSGQRLDSQRTCSFGKNPINFAILSINAKYCSRSRCISTIYPVTINIHAVLKGTVSPDIGLNFSV